MVLVEGQGQSENQGIGKVSYSTGRGLIEFGFYRHRRVRLRKEF